VVGRDVRFAIYSARNAPQDLRRYHSAEESVVIERQRLDVGSADRQQLVVGSADRQQLDVGSADAEGGLVVGEEGFVDFENVVVAVADEEFNDDVEFLAGREREPGFQEEFAGFRE